MGDLIQPLVGALMGFAMGGPPGAAMGFGGGLLSGYEKNRSEKKAESMYNQYSLPDPKTVEATRASETAKIDKSVAGGLEQLGQFGATRGWGRGSGLLGQGAQGLIKKGVEAKGQLGSDLTKWRYTRQFAPSGGMLSGGGTPGTDMMSTGLGLLMAKQIFGGSGGGMDFGFGSGGGIPFMPWQ